MKFLGIPNSYELHPKFVKKYPSLLSASAGLTGIEIPTKSGPKLKPFLFAMIAGSFTPICLLVLPGNTGIQLLFIIWIIAGIGILQTVLFTETPRLIRAGIYLVAGYMAIPYLSVMFSVMSMTNFILTAASGTIYTVGAIGYGFQFPDISPKYFGYHEFFHILVSIAAVLHFIVIYSIVG